MGRPCNILSGDIKCIMNVGMPSPRRQFDKGRLIIKFNVSYAWNNGDNDDDKYKKFIDNIDRYTVVARLRLCDSSSTILGK